MRAVFGFVGILMALGIVFLVYSTQIKGGPDGVPLPQQTNLVAVKRDLLSFGQAERLYWTTNGSYATMEQLRGSRVVSVLPGDKSWGYEYDIEMHGTDNFLITARPVDPGLNLPTFSIDKTMQISP